MSTYSIVYATDFSSWTGGAFAHALRVALATKGDLRLVHVKQQDEGLTDGFPNVQRLLVQWGLLDEADPPETIAGRLGVALENVLIERQAPAPAIVSYLDRMHCDLLVVATQGRDGIDHWLQGSVAETVFSRSRTLTLFVPRGARGFVDQVTGDVRLRHVLVPVDWAPPPERAVEAARSFSRLLNGRGDPIQLLHVGSSVPPLPVADLVTVRDGNAVQTILDAAVEYDADLICMATAGHQGVFDAIRGSTTERVLRHAPCPVLAIPAG